MAHESILGFVCPFALVAESSADHSVTAAEAMSVVYVELYSINKPGQLIGRAPDS